MKKTFIVALLVGTLALNPFAVNAKEVGLKKGHDKKIKEQVHQLAEKSPIFDEVSVEEVPSGTPVIQFDTVQEFEKALKQMEQDMEVDQEAQLNQAAFVPSESDLLMARASIGRIKWAPTSWNPLKATILPLNMWIDFYYSSSGSGSSKKFTSVSSIKSQSNGFPSSWHQTHNVHSFYDSNRGVSITISGYHLLGVSVGGQAIGAKFSDTITQKYHF